MTQVEIKSKIRWTSADKEWLQQAVNTIAADGYEKVARMLQEEVDKL